MAEEDIGHLNVMEYGELIKRKQVEDDKNRLNVGFIWAALHNTAAFADPNRVAKQPTDIVDSMRQKKEFDLRDLSPEEQKSYIMNTFYGSGKKQFSFKG